MIDIVQNLKVRTSVVEIEHLTKFWLPDFREVFCVQEIEGNFGFEHHKFYFFMS